MQKTLHVWRDVYSFLLSGHTIIAVKMASSTTFVSPLVDGGRPDSDRFPVPPASLNPPKFRSNPQQLRLGG